MKPLKILLPLHEETEMVLGDSRTIETIFYGENNDLSDKDYNVVTEKNVEWKTEPEGIVTVDKYGRLETLKTGVVKITVKSCSNPSACDSKKIKVLEKASLSDKPLKEIVNFNGEPVKTVNNLQKVIDRFNSLDEFNDRIPEQVIEAVKMSASNKKVEQQNIVWEIVDFSDGSEGRLVKRTDLSKTDSDKDKFQYFVGNRYLPGEGKNPVAILDDANNGIWVIGKKDETPLITNIKMLDINYEDKAVMMSDHSVNFTSRMGMMSEAKWNGENWITELNDNDGLWTAMYDGGELMR